MRRIDTDQRTCRKCLKPFPSTGKGNRICPKCTVINSKLYDKRTTMGHTGRSGGLPSGT
jgi:hypothetical protein